MKKLLLLGFVIAVSMINQSAKAQFDYIGGGLALASGAKYKIGDETYINSSIGLDLRASYNLNKKIKIVPDFKFYFPKKGSVSTNTGDSKTTAYALNINLHYILKNNPRENYRLYLLAGAHVAGWNIKDNTVTAITTLDVNEFKIFPGGNAGAGMQFDIGNRTKFFAEIKYVIAKTQQVVFAPGLIYNI